jgi:hypothetical protein
MAQVDERTARRVARQETDCYKRALSGVYGDEERENAEYYGLSGLAFTRRETRRGWLIYDLCTNTEHFEPFEWKWKNKVSRRVITFKPRSRARLVIRTIGEPIGLPSPVVLGEIIGLREDAILFHPDGERFPHRIPHRNVVHAEEVI